MIYRGHNITQSDGKWIVSKGGKILARADNKQSAMDFVKIENRKEAQGQWLLRVAEGW